MMLAAINEALERKLFTLTPNDKWAAKEPEIYSFVFQGTPHDIPAIAYINDAGFDELKFHVAFWPTHEADRLIACIDGGLAVGEAWAAGWLERRDGCWLQVSKGTPMFSCRRAYLSTLASLVIEPKGYDAAGPFRF